jgi:hypothetical protein
MHTGYPVDKYSELEGVAVSAAPSRRKRPRGRVRAAKEPGLGSARVCFGRVDQGEAVFPLTEAKRRPHRLAPGTD